MSDPRDRDFRNPAVDRRSNAAWGWIAGAVFVVIALVLVFGYSMNTETASNASNPPAATTGAGPATPKPANPPAPSAKPSSPSPAAPASPGSGGQAR